MCHDTYLSSFLIVKSVFQIAFFNIFFLSLEAFYNHPKNYIKIMEKSPRLMSYLWNFKLSREESHFWRPNAKKLQCMLNKWELFQQMRKQVYIMRTRYMKKFKWNKSFFWISDSFSCIYTEIRLTFECFSS